MDSDPEHDQPALDVESVSFAYGTKQVLDDVSFTVPKGQVTFLLGPNGAGKSTLFSLITRLFDARQGQVRISGLDLKSAGAQALAPLGVVFQQSTLDLDLTVRQNLAYYGALRGLSKSGIEARAHVCLDALEMSERSGELVRKLNGGHRRRVEIARALMHHPEILLLDEPTVGLDPTTRQAIVGRIHELATNDGTAILWATHLVDEVRDEDHLLALSAGRLIASGNVRDVLASLECDDLTTAYARLFKAGGQ